MLKPTLNPPGKVYHCNSCGRLTSEFTNFCSCGSSSIAVLQTLEEGKTEKLVVHAGMPTLIAQSVLNIHKGINDFGFACNCGATHYIHEETVKEIWRRSCILLKA